MGGGGGEVRGEKEGGEKIGETYIEGMEWAGGGGSTRANGAQRGKWLMVAGAWNGLVGGGGGGGEKIWP